MLVTRLFGRALPMLATALVLSACTDIAAPSTPELGAQFGTGSVTRSAGSGGLVERDAPAERDSVYATIDERGGELRAGGHVMTIPKRAVTEPTVFTMRVVPGNNIHVDLTARTVRTGTEVTRFGREVKLRLSWENGKVADRRRLRVAYLLDDSATGRQELLRTVVHVHGHVVDTELTHFSQYAIAFD